MVPSGKASSVTIPRPITRPPSGAPARADGGPGEALSPRHDAPKGGPLIDTKTTGEGSGCEGAAGSFYCKASYEPLPKGTYRWKIAWVGTPKKPAHVELTVRW
jgi:hypothetical protein